VIQRLKRNNKNCKIFRRKHKQKLNGVGFGNNFLALTRELKTDKLDFMEFNLHIKRQYQLSMWHIPIIPEHEADAG
jgi:hypothetical protein